jgi:hypothetical protein
MAVGIPQGTFGTEAAQGGGTTTQVGQIPGRLRACFNGLGGSNQLPQFKQWRGAPPAIGKCALKYSLLIPKTQRADTTLVIDSEKKVQFPENGDLDRGVLSPCCRALLCMIAKDHATPPTVRLSVGNGTMKE